MFDFLTNLRAGSTQPTPGDLARYDRGQQSSIPEYSSDAMTEAQKKRMGQMALASALMSAGKQAGQYAPMQSAPVHSQTQYSAGGQLINPNGGR